MRNAARREEDLSKRYGSRCQAGLHCRRSQFRSESKSSMSSHKVVMTANEFKILFETFRVACVGGGLSSQVCAGRARGEIGSFDEGRVELDRVLRFCECAVDLASGSDDDPRIHLPDSVLAP